jgi:hypothetical protein
VIESITNRPVNPREGIMVYLYCFFDLGARCGWVVSTIPRPFYPQGRPGASCTGGRVSTRVSLARCRKSGFSPWNVESIASCYNDYTVWLMVPLQLTLKVSGMLVWCS